MITAKKKYGDITDTETQVAKLMTSVDDFETRFLPAKITGSTALYQRLNALISAYGLTNSSGPDYRPLEVSEAERRRGSDDQSGGREKLKSIFPGVFVTVTVEGSYQNLRGFIREIETSDQFILINSVQLEPAETEDDSKPTATTVTTIQQNPNDPTAPPVRTTNVVRKNENRGRTRGQTVSLRLEMAAYFRRPINAVVEPIAQPTPNAKTGN
ncbi:MAG: GspMb/PilO family protein [Aridibacter sp.]